MRLKSIVTRVEPAGGRDLMIRGLAWNDGATPITGVEVGVGRRRLRPRGTRTGRASLRLPTVPPPLGRRRPPGEHRLVSRARDGRGLQPTEAEASRYRATPWENNGQVVRPPPAVAAAAEASAATIFGMENRRPLHRTLPGWGLALAAACLSLLPAPASAARQFTEVTGPAGLRFDHRTGRGEAGRPPYFMPKIMGSGLGLLDHDGDGDLDLYLVQGAGADRLFENLGDFRFREAAAGRPAAGAGGVRNGGWRSATPTTTATSISSAPGTAGTRCSKTPARPPGSRAASRPRGRPPGDDRWSASAAFCDYDADGRLDLFVTRYMDYDPDFTCHAADGRQDYCNPADIGGLPDLLYRNLGGGRFREVGPEGRGSPRSPPGVSGWCATTSRATGGSISMWRTTPRRTTSG